MQLYIRNPPCPRASPPYPQTSPSCPRASPSRAQYFEVKSPAKIQEAIGIKTPRERVLLPRRSLKAKKTMLDYSQTVFQDLMCLIAEYS